MDDEATIQINIETRDSAVVPLATISETIKSVAALIEQLTKEVAPDANLVWGITSLHLGSAVLEAAPIIQNSFTEYGAKQVARALETTTALASEGNYASIPYSARVRALMVHINDLLSDDVPGIAMGPKSHVQRIARLKIIPRSTQDISYGSVSGFADTISGHDDLRFSLYDDVFDHAITCYLAGATKPYDLPSLFQKHVEVTGLIAADPETGRIETVRQIEDIVVLPDSGADYTKTDGVWKGWESTWEDRLEALRRVRRGD